MSDIEPMYTPQEVAALLKCGPRKVKRDFANKSGVLTIRDGPKQERGMLRIPHSVLAAYIREHTQVER